MTVLVVVETLLLILLSLLVAGLLRSHGEILRRLEARESAPAASHAAARPPELRTRAPARDGAPPAPDVAGFTLRGEPVKIAVRSAPSGTLLAFLTSGCATCRGFWEGLQPAVRPTVPGGARIVVVTKDSSYESPSKLRSMAPPDLPVVMSSEAWETYRVPGSPYFVYVDGSTGRIHGEGMAGGWAQVVSLLRDALADAELADGPGPDGIQPGNGRATAPDALDGRSERATRADQELSAAGIGEGHPSLYAADDPAGRQGREG
jgi:hypothetical protein